MVCVCSYLQAPIQAILKPSMWLPLVKKTHSYKEKWSMQSSKFEFFDQILEGIQHFITEDSRGFSYDIYKVDRDNLFIRLFVYTKAEWLDVVEIKMDDSFVYVESFSSGLFPLWIPFVLILNLIFFWFPFYDFKMNESTIKGIGHSVSSITQCDLVSGQKDEYTGQSVSEGLTDIVTA